MVKTLYDPEVERRGKIEGKKEGKKEGVALTITALEAFQEGKELNYVMEKTGLDKEELIQIQAMIMKK